jgi:hypothetical protein
MFGEVNLGGLDVENGQPDLSARLGTKSFF